MTEIKPGLWRAGVVIPLGIVACIAIAGAVSEFTADRPGEAVAALLAPVGIYGMFAIVANGLIAALTGRHLEWKGRAL